MMFKFNVILFICFMYWCLSIECQASIIRNRCPTIQLNNGRVRLRSGGRIAKIVCNWPFKLVHGHDIVTCVNGEWDNETPICARTGCTIVDEISHGRLNVANEGAKLELSCDVGYIIDGPSFIYCNEDLEWNGLLKGCKEHDQIYLSCNFESSNERFCGWKNDIFNDIDWLADKWSFFFSSSRHHVTPGSSQYFIGNYISLDAGNYGSSTVGRLLSPPLLPVKNKYMCLMFSYKVTSENLHGISILSVTYGGIPHWSTLEGEGAVTIGLYKLNVISNIVIEGKNCKAAIDNIIITEGNHCTQPSYKKEVTCLNNCGVILMSNYCSCDWECHNNNNCCSDITKTCPYIKPSEEIVELYLTSTTVTSSKINTIVKNNVSTVTVSNMFSLKNSNEFEVSNKTRLSMLLNLTDNKTTNSVTPLKLSFNTTYSTFTHIPTTTSTIKLMTIKKMLSETTTGILETNNTLNLNSSLLHNDVSNITTISSIPKYSTINSNTLANFSTYTKILINTTSWIPYKPQLINKTVLTKLPNTSNLTTFFNVRNTTRITPKLINISNSTLNPLNGNTISSTSTLINSLNTNIFLSALMTTTLVNNYSTTTKPLIINTTSTIKLINPFNNISMSNIKEFGIKLITKTPSRQNITKNVIVIETKSIMNNDSNTHFANIIDNLNSSTVSNKNFDFDTSHPNISLISLKYNTDLKNHQSLNNNNSQNIIIKLIDHTEKLNPLWNNDKSTKFKTSNAKPELNYSLYNQHLFRKNEWLDGHNNINDNVKTSKKFDNVTIVKYLTAIGVILIIFKYIIYLIKLYFKKHIDDELNTCFVEMDNSSSCNMELIPNRVE